ncbi:MAG TPA: Crp/Fnr family transcriptional regulator [bacterium]|nr:Crp/Fnr family transcriptional regulator [bacterium]
MEKTDALKKTELFGPLSEAEIKALAEACVVHPLKKGETLFNAGEEAKGLYVIAKGSLKAFRGNTEGREQVIHVERAGTTIAEVPVFDDKPYPSTVVAEEDSEVLFISKEDVKRLCLKHPAIALSALKLLAARLRRTAALAESLSLKEVDQRLAAFLLKEFKEKRLKKLKLPTNSVLAARLGSVREVVSRAFAKLEADGLIKVDEHRNAELLSEDGLKKYAEG